MTDSEQDEFEKQLRRTRPATLPADFAARLLAAKPERKAAEPSVPLVPAVADYFWRHWNAVRWLIPATAAVLAVMLAWHESQPLARRSSLPAPGLQAENDAPLLKADEVKIDQTLVSSFDAVARLPGGEPVRFRCENWMDQFVLSDKSRGVVVENRRPRFEVVPVRYETY